ncbi:pseudouridine synthase [Zongyangia hominis]|uniref:Pseudouridine synthase n=1 Tax=Zongyangia hominis TaxID=2763677 RepID=A0A926EF46_9FIRM|nr:pseudouridine synthase [Zongyangia hominis]MBC8571014.1 rRNA pseudouridine synthase [Zongyangia hominis]
MERLDKVLANMGAGSRKEVKALIRQGRVRVDGAVVSSGETKVDPEESRIEVDGAPVRYQRHVYLMMNKPLGVISASSDPKEKTVVDLVPERWRHWDLFPAGRLDKDTEGFVLLTDDGAFAHDILSPRKHIPKTYVAKVDIPLDERAVKAFASGMDIGAGQICQSAELILRETEGGQECVVVLKEGMYHQIKRMFGALGGKVLSLKRVRMGDLPLDESLAPGECRELTKEELARVQCRG